MRTALITAAAAAAILIIPSAALAQAGSVTIERDGGSITLYDAPERVARAAPAPRALQTTELEVWVEGTAATATGALSAADLAAQRVVRAMAAAGAAGRIDAEGVDVVAHHEPRRLAPRRNRIEERGRLIGFRASRLVVVTAPAGRDAGLLMDLATGAGATDIFVGSVGPRPEARIGPASVPAATPARVPGQRAERGQRYAGRLGS
jgi:uncharacterized protein YggE